MKTRPLLCVLLLAACDPGSPFHGGGGGDMLGDGSYAGSTDMAHGGTSTDMTTPTGPIKNVFIILMENHNWSDIKMSTSATYIQSLLPLGAHAEMYFNPPSLHPSEPNYLWLEAGTNFGITSDSDPASHHQSSTAHLVTQLEAAGVTWKSYQENITGTTCPLAEANKYVPRHNPMVYFDDVTNTNDPASARCIAHVRPYTDLAGDLSGGTVARYNFITPNLCNDMHGSDVLAGDFDCVGGLGFGADLIKIGDDWLKANVPAILNYVNANNGVLFITWDEGENSVDGPIGFLALGPKVKSGGPTGYSNSTMYTHSSTLRSLQEIFGVSPFLGGAATSNDLSDLFVSFP